MTIGKNDSLMVLEVNGQILITTEDSRGHADTEVWSGNREQLHSDLVLRGYHRVSQGRGAIGGLYVRLASPQRAA